MINLDIFILCVNALFQLPCLYKRMSVMVKALNGKGLEPFNISFIIITLITNPMQYTEN